MRPIDADAMHKFVEDKVAEGKDGWANGVPYEWAYALTAVDMQPTLDYAPVKHGEWVDEIESNAVTASGREVHVFRCSACDFTWANKTAVLHYFQHCPNCGAKMDGGKENV